MHPAQRGVLSFLLLSIVLLSIIPSASAAGLAEPHNVYLHAGIDGELEVQPVHDDRQDTRTVTSLNVFEKNHCPFDSGTTFDIPTTMVGWTGSAYLSGTGNVWVRMIISIDGTDVDQQDSGPITLGPNPGQVDLQGQFEMEGSEQLLCITYQIRVNSLVASVNFHFGPSNPTGLRVEDVPALAMSDLMVLEVGELNNNGSIDGMLFHLDVSYLFGGPGQMTSGPNLTIPGHSTQAPSSFEPIVNAPGVWRIQWTVNNLTAGSTIIPTLWWEDGAATTQTHSFPEVVVAQPQSGEEGDGLIRYLQWLTIPLLAVLLWPLRNRHKRVCEAEPEIESRELTTILGAVSLVMLVQLNIGFFVFSYHSREIGASEPLVVLHIGLLALLLGAAGPVWGWIADKTGERLKLILWSQGIGAALLLTLPFLSLWPFIFVSLIHFGLLASIRIHIAILTEWASHVKGEIIGLTYALGYLATAAWAIVSGTIYESVGLWANCAAGGLAIVASMYLMTRIRRDRLDREIIIEATLVEEEEEGGSQSAISKLSQSLGFQSGWVKWISLGVLLVAIPRGAVVLTSPRYIETLGFNLEWTSLFEGWAIIALVLLYSWTGWLCDKFGAEKVLLGAALGYGVLWSLFSLGLPGWLSIAIYLIPIVPLLLVADDALLARFTAPEERARGMGVAGAAAYVGQAIGIALVVGMMTWMEGMFSTDTELYLWAYRSNIPLFAAAIAMTWWLSKRLDGVEGPGDSDG